MVLLWHAMTAQHSFDLEQLALALKSGTNEHLPSNALLLAHLLACCSQSSERLQL